MNRSTDKKAYRDHREVGKVVTGTPTTDGAGVRLTRMIGARELDYLDPFLLLDAFGTDRPEEYIAGFPAHPHRGMETVTYMVDGQVVHRDHLGHTGTIGPGDAQWMTAGSGIIHSEMPAIRAGRLQGLQLWVNLPKSDKMCDPHYRELKSEAIPMVQRGGVTVKVIAGQYADTQGPLNGLAVGPTYMDVTLDPGADFTTSLPATDHAFALVLDGEINFGPNRTAVNTNQLAVLTPGGKVVSATSDRGGRFIFGAGAPLHEPVARGGPFVMNTQAEIELAWSELRAGTFIKKGAQVSDFG